MYIPLPEGIIGWRQQVDNRNCLCKVFSFLVIGDSDSELGDKSR